MNVRAAATAAMTTLMIGAASFLGFAAPASATPLGSTISISLANDSADTSEFADMALELYDSAGTLLVTAGTLSGTPSDSLALGGGAECFWSTSLSARTLNCINMPVSTYSVGATGQTSAVELYVDNVSTSSTPVEPLIDVSATFTTVVDHTTTVTLGYGLNDVTNDGWLVGTEIALEDTDAMGGLSFEIYNAGGTLVYTGATLDTALASSTPSTSVLGGTCLTSASSGASSINYWIYCYGLPADTYTVGATGADFTFAVETTKAGRYLLASESLLGTSSSVSLTGSLHYVSTLTYSDVLAATGLSSEFLNGSVFAAFGLIGLGAGALVLARRRQGAAV